MDRTIGSCIEEARLRAHMSQRDVAIVCGLNTKTVGRWERGERIPRADHIVVMARVFSRSADELLGLSPEFTPRPRTRIEKVHIVRGYDAYQGIGS